MTWLIIGLITGAAGAGGETVISIGEEVVLYSQVLGEERTISVALPAGYENSDREYPVLIVLDCGNSTALAYAVSTMEMLDSKSQAPQMIIAGIDTGPGARDYFPLPLPGRPGSGCAEKFLQFITGEVLPLLDQKYRTAPFRVLSGASNSGMFAIYAMMENPGMFPACVAASPSLGWFPDYFSGRIREFSPPSGTVLYVNWGSDDLERIVLSALPELSDELDIVFEESGFYQSEIIQDGGHVPYVSLHNGLRSVFQGWQLPDPQLLSGGLSGLRGHYNELTLRYGFEVVIPAGKYMTLGQHLFRQEEPEQALDVFRAYQESYPESSRAAFFTGETHRVMGDSTSAEECYRRSTELDPGFTMAAERLESLIEGEQ